MRFIRLAGLLFCLFILPVMVEAQETWIWPPESPQALFVSPVQIVSTLQTSTLMPVYGFAEVHTELRLIAINDTRIIPFPPTLPPYLITWKLLGDQLYLRASEYRDGGPFNYWRLDLDSNQWTELFTGSATPTIETYCGNLGWEQIVSIWILITGRNRQQHLCNLSNGRVSPALPVGYVNWNIGFFPLNPHIPSRQAPDGTGYVVLQAQHIDTPEVYRMFAMDMMRYSLLPIDEFTGLQSTRIQVLDDNAVDLRTAPLTAANSDSRLFQRYLLRFVELEARVIPDDMYYSYSRRHYARYTEYLVDGSASCELTTLDIGNTQFNRLVVPLACTVEDTYENFDYYRILHPDNTSADVIQVDITTGEAQTIYTGEVETIIFVRERLQLGAFIIGSNGMIDTKPGQLEIVPDSNLTRLVIVDLVNGNILFETQAGVGNVPYEWYPRLNTISDTSVMFYDGPTTYLLELRNGDLEVRTIEGGLSQPVGDDWAFIYPPEYLVEFDGTHEVSIYNLETHQTFPIVALYPVRDYYRFSHIEYAGNNLFKLTINAGSLILADYGYYDSIEYTFRLLND